MTSSQAGVFAAVDIGASSGRVVAGIVGEDRLELDIVHRFPNGAQTIDGRLRWDLTALFEQVLTGLSALAERYPDVTSIGIDTWAVDYGLLDAHGQLLAEPVAYRDERTNSVIEDVHQLIGPQRLYEISGLQFLPFNTVYQLAAEQRGPLWPGATRALLLPDLLGYWLTGQQRTEITNASTTGLLDATSRQWAGEIFDVLAIPGDLFPPLIEPGEALGPIRPDIAERTGLSGSVSVVAVGSHDTASAVAAVPMPTAGAAYISSGTWSLVGVELDRPVLTEASRTANFTNEGGVDGGVRYLHNVMGLWLLSESIRSWTEDGHSIDLPRLLAEAEALPGPISLFDTADPSLLPPGNIPARIAALTGDPVPRSPAEVTRSICESLAAAYAGTLDDAERLSGRLIEVVHVVGGGSQNALLNQLTADRCGRPVLAGPVEATAIGNILVQARTAGLVGDSLEDLRQLVAKTFPSVPFSPLA